jgi:MFS superfamily sulfate permease-like transporter
VIIVVVRVYAAHPAQRFTARAVTVTVTVTVTVAVAVTIAVAIAITVPFPRAPGRIASSGRVVLATRVEREDDAKGSNQEQASPPHAILP